MNCEEVKADLPLFLYGDIDHQRAVGLQQHVADCEQCQTERDELIEIRKLLDGVPQPSTDVFIDAGPIVSQPYINQPAKSRRFGRLTIISALVLVTVAVLFSRAEIRWEQHQLIVRWGTPIPSVYSTPEPERPHTIQESDPEEIHAAQHPRLQQIPQQSVARKSDAEARLRLLDELVQVLTQEVTSNGLERRADIAEFERRLTKLEHEARSYRAGAERTIAALYTAQFSDHAHGDKP